MEKVGEGARTRNFWWGREKSGRWQGGASRAARYGKWKAKEEGKWLVDSGGGGEATGLLQYCTAILYAILYAILVSQPIQRKALLLPSRNCFTPACALPRCCAALGRHCKSQVHSHGHSTEVVIEPIVSKLPRREGPIDRGQARERRARE